MSLFSGRIGNRLVAGLGFRTRPAATRFGAVLFLTAWFLYFAGDGIFAPFSGDDLMNLHGYLGKSVATLAADNLRYWSTSYRPLGGLFYVCLYDWFGFNPLPFRIACFVMLAANQVLLFAVCRRLSGSAEVGFLATFLVSYHAWFVDLYYSSGTVYELLCFTFYFSTFLVYIRIRQAGRAPTPRELAVLAGLYICALNAKEMAVTLPLFLGVYELLYAGPRRRWAAAALTAALTVPYVAGKLVGAGSLTEVPAYELSISPGRYLDTFHLYLNSLFYQDHVFRDPNTVQLLVGMLVLGAVLRSKPLLFAWSFLVLSILPVAFIAHYAAFFLYIPSVGWALYAATCLAGLRRFVEDKIRRPLPQVALLVVLAGLLAPLHARESVATLRLFRSVQPPSRALAKELLRRQPHLKRGARVLFVGDPFPADDYFLLFLTRLVYHDMTIQVDRTTAYPQPGIEHHDLVFVYGAG